ncbi:hypothetical protein [Bosea sp. 124]|nr:hypothetical protein [Bosea sp. 124]PTM40794.1 hypothetical protein C8D03_2325 [Bosea sp. 124]
MPVRFDDAIGTLGQLVLADDRAAIVCLPHEWEEERVAPLELEPI